jgi:hypothetical protein
MAGAAPDDCTRRWLARMARVFELEARLAAKSKRCLAESKELLTVATVVLGRAHDALLTPQPAPPFLATDEQGPSTLSA